MFKPFLITAWTLSAFSFRPYFSNSTINRCPDITFLWGYRDLSFWASWRYAVWSSSLTDPCCSSEILSFQYWTSSGHLTEYFSLHSLLINFSRASRMSLSSAFSFLRSSAWYSVSRASRLWHPFPSFSSCDIHPSQKSPGLPKSLSEGKIPFSLVSLARIPSLGFPSLLRTYVLPPLRPTRLLCPEWTPSWKWFWKEFPSDRISLSSDPACPNRDHFPGKERAVISGFWFSGICCSC